MKGPQPAGSYYGLPVYLCDRVPAGEIRLLPARDWRVVTLRMLGPDLEAMYRAAGGEIREPAVVARSIDDARRAIFQLNESRRG